MDQNLHGASFWRESDPLEHPRSRDRPLWGRLRRPPSALAKGIAELYGFRWLAELDIRVVKVSLGLDVVRCLTPEMVRKEIWTALLAYNLIRRIMLQAAQGTGRTPRQLSFSAALQTVAASWLVIVLASDTVAARLVEVQLENLAEHLIGQRPGRVEPRAVKRRPKQQALLTKPRKQAPAELLAQRS